jgi:hypothetical protein
MGLRSWGRRLVREELVGHFCWVRLGVTRRMGRLPVAHIDGCIVVSAVVGIDVIHQDS